MANAIQTATIITNEVLRIAHNNSAFLGNMNTDYMEAWNGTVAPGSTLQARRPVQFTTRTGAAANIQDITDSTVPILVQPELGIDFAVSDYELSTAVRSDGSIDDTFRMRYMKPAGLKIATQLDFNIATLVKNQAANVIGTPGTAPSTILDILNAQVPMDWEAAPRDDERYVALSPVSNASVTAGLGANFNSQALLAANYKAGMVAQPQLGLNFMMSQNIPSHTVGPLGGTPLVNGANQGLTNAGTTDNPYAATTSLITNGWTAAAAVRLNQGDVFTIAGVFAVNPETKQSTGQLRQFLVTAQVSSDASGNLTAVISPAIIAGGAYQNVTARPANSAAITVVTGAANTTYSQNMLWHRDAITFVSPKQPLPKGMDMASQASMADSGGATLRFVRGFDILNNRFVSRFDVLWGAAVTQQGWVVRRTN